MVNNLPVRFPIRSSGVVSSFDFTDIATGLGYETYYGFGTKETDHSTITYLLAPFSSIIWPNEVKKTLTTAGANSSVTVNFDTSVFNLPRTVKGTAIVNFMWANETGGLVANAQISAQLFKVHADGTTTTALTSAKTKDRDTTTALAIGEEENVLMYLPLTQTNIKKGEKLRLQIILYVNSFPRTVSFHHDPQGRNSVANTDVSTQLKVLVPYRIDK